LRRGPLRRQRHLAVGGEGDVLRASRFAVLSQAPDEVIRPRPQTIEHHGGGFRQAGGEEDRAVGADQAGDQALRAGRRVDRQARGAEGEVEIEERLRIARPEDHLTHRRPGAVPGAVRVQLRGDPPGSGREAGDEVPAVGIGLPFVDRRAVLDPNPGDLSRVEAGKLAAQDEGALEGEIDRRGAIGHLEGVERRR